MLIAVQLFMPFVPSHVFNEPTDMCVVVTSANRGPDPVDLSTSRALE